MDIGGSRYAATLMGISNTFATIPGIVGNIVTGWLLYLGNGDWTMVFNVIIVVYLIGGIVYLALARGDRIFK